MREKRRYPRHPTWFPVQLDRGDGVGRIGACVDGSASGLLLRCPESFELGERVGVVFRVLPSQTDWIRAEAEVIRVHVEAPIGGERSPWPVWVALRLATPIPKLELLLQLSEERRGSGRYRHRRRTAI